MNSTRTPSNIEFFVTKDKVHLLAQNRDQKEIVEKNGNSALALAHLFAEAREEIFLFATDWHDMAFETEPGKALKSFLERNGTKLTIILKDKILSENVPDFLSAYIIMKSFKVELIIVSVELSEIFFNIHSADVTLYNQFPIIADSNMCQVRFFPPQESDEEMFTSTTYAKNDSKLAQSNLDRLKALIHEARETKKKIRAEEKEAVSNL